MKYLLHIQTTGPGPVDSVYDSPTEPKRFLSAWQEGKLQGLVGDTSCPGPWLVKAESIVSIQVCVLPDNAEFREGQPEVGPAPFGRRLPPGTSGLA